MPNKKTRTPTEKKINNELKKIWKEGHEMYLSNDGFYKNIPIKRIGYKSLNGFIQMLRRQNKSLEKLGCAATFTITLPIREK